MLDNVFGCRTVKGEGLVAAFAVDRAQDANFTLYVARPAGEELDLDDEGAFGCVDASKTSGPGPLPSMCEASWPTCFFPKKRCSSALFQTLRSKVLGPARDLRPT